MLIDATHAEETRVVVVDGNKVEEFDFESENKRQLAGNIYLAKVTRVEPSLQAAFVDYGGNRHGFLAFSEIHPDYYQIPVADREALMEEERAYVEAMRARDEEDERKSSKSKSKSRSKSKTSTKAADVTSKDPVETKEVETPETGEPQISGMETIDLSDTEDSVADPLITDDSGLAEVPEGSSPMETVRDTPVEEPGDAEDPAEAAVDSAEADATADAAEEPAVSEVEASDTSEEAHEPVQDAADADTVKPDAETEVAETNAPADDTSAEEVQAEDAADDSEPSKVRSDAASKDSSIESVADDDDQDDIRPPRKPRPRRYKIQEVIKVRQILLVQVVKEERGNKGAALTTYLSLAGRYCVLMPNTARGGGISRKILEPKLIEKCAGQIQLDFQGIGDCDNGGAAGIQLFSHAC